MPARRYYLIAGRPVEKKVEMTCDVHGKENCPYCRIYKSTTPILAGALIAFVVAVVALTASYLEDMKPVTHQAQGVSR